MNERLRHHIRDTVNSTIQELLPPVLYRLIRSSAGLLQFSLFRSKGLLQPNQALPNQGRGRRAFLLATGPSLKQENLQLLEGEDCYSVSNFYLHPAVELIKPKMHFFAPWHEPLILENYLEWLRQADARLPAETAICLTHLTAELVHRHRLFQQRRVYYMYMSVYHHPKMLNLLKPVAAPTTGPLMILPMLIAMGYREIYLLGCDHTILRDYGRNIQHFYDRNQEVRKNASDGAVWAGTIPTIGHQLAIFEQYRYYQTMVRRYYPQTSIINLSQDSWLDLFPKDRLEAVIAKQSAGVLSN